MVDRKLSDAALRLSDLGSRLRPPERRIAEVSAQLGNFEGRLSQIIDHKLNLQQAALDQAGRLLAANSFERVLDRGFALVSDENGRTVKRAAEAPEGARVTLRFADASRTAQLDPDGKPPKGPSARSVPRTSARPKSDETGQDSLF